MIYHSIIPYDIAFASEPPSEHILPYMVTQYRGITMQVSGGGSGKYSIERLISSNPQDFLRSDMRVGSVFTNADPL